MALNLKTCCSIACPPMSAITEISAAMVAIVAARAIAAGRELTGPEPLYLRAPDVTLPAPRKRVGS